ncbi:piggyBac transposable element-derived protein 4-like [Nilaparvata lugens]|uniref:piggyBac transposable element-derived protein 4-like n=1 Tax=Nilaparvata lugens TaxID=108931 RepID=UPI00193DBA58|nr:piggyBac transposable element-derived protein 4-like [Nilaparvata lugens]
MARETYDTTNQKNIEELRRFLEDDDDEDPAANEDLGEESDIDSQDEVEEQQGDSDTEQDCDKFSDDEDTTSEKTDETFFLGKDKKTNWLKKSPGSTFCRVQSQNIVTHLPGVKGNARNAKSAFECWSNLFTDNILDTIVTCTNQYMNSIKDQFSRERDIKPTDVIELKAYIGLLYLAGAYKANRQCLEELWGAEGDGVEKFSLVMNLKRFKTLTHCLRFDDRTNRADRKKYDRLAPVREVFEKFVENCQKSYCVGENVTLDEMLPGFRGRCSFKQYIPSKPNKYGIKVYALVDARMTYTMKMEIYAGKQPAGPYCLSNKPTDVVRRMVEPIVGTGRNITADNWFTDVDLVDELRKKKLSYCKPEHQALANGHPSKQKNKLAPNLWKGNNENSPSQDSSTGPEKSATPATKRVVPAKINKPTALHDASKQVLTGGNPFSDSAFVHNVVERELYMRETFSPCTPALTQVTRDVFTQLSIDKPDLTKRLIPEELNYYAAAML